MSGEYPADWSKPELGDFARATGGSRFPPEAQGNSGGDYPFYKVSDMNLPGNERFMGVANNWITETTRKKIKARTFPAGSVIFPKIGAAVATNKKRLLTQESIIDNNVMAVVVDDTDMCAYSYLRYWFETIDLRDLSNSGTLPSIPGHRVHTMHIPLPPLPEQKKIAHILSTVQRATEAQERIIQTTTELKKALMHKLFTEGLRNEPQKQTEIGPIPESWKVVRIKSTGTVVTGSTPSTKNPEFYGGNYNLISPADLDDRKYVRSAHKTLTQSGFEKCQSIPRNSVLVGCIGNIGKIGMIGDDCSATNQQINSIIPKEDFSPHFLYYVLLTCRPRLEKTAAKVTVPILNKSNFENFQIAVASRTDQDVLAGYFGILDKKLEIAREKETMLQELFRTLLHKLMSAKMRVHNL